MTLHAHTAALLGDIPGAQACCLMGVDGLPVATAAAAAAPADAVAQLTALAPWAGGLMRSLAGGPPRAVTIAGERFSWVLRPLSARYFVGVLLGPAGVAGQARFAIDQRLPALVDALAA